MYMCPPHGPYMPPSRYPMNPHSTMNPYGYQYPYAQKEGKEG